MGQRETNLLMLIGLGMGWGRRLNFAHCFFSSSADSAILAFIFFKVYSYDFSAFFIAFTSFAEAVLVAIIAFNSYNAFASAFAFADCLTRFI